MTREELEQRMVEMLYGEISGEDRRRFEAWLDQNPEAKAEYGEIERTHRLLNCLDEAPASVLPLRASLKASTPPRRWGRWLAAAACLAAIFCVSQGVVLQVGDVRLALGPAADASAVREEIRAEFQRNYQPAVDQLVKTAEQMVSQGQTVADRQDAMERSMMLLASFRKVDQELTQRKMKDFSVDLMRAIDDRLNNIYALAYNPIPYSANDASPGFESKKNN
ncbi:MAG: hypothetical protein AB1656_24265 [Candidatus Omnitrophota bacterium]